MTDIGLKIKFQGSGEKHSYKTKKNFEGFFKLSGLSLLKRKKFIEDLISDKELSLTDGLVILKKKGQEEMSCDFYNKDGSTAEMCGNAACCVSTYIHWMSLPVKSFQFGEEKVSCSAKGGISLDKIPSPLADYDFNFNGMSFSFILIKPGVPHAVLECKPKGRLDFKDKTTLKKLAQSLRFKNPKDEKGMNVSFFQIEKENRLKAISYERGVEGFTLACGTGALAVASVYRHNHQIKNTKTITVTMPGGELKVQFEPQASLFSPVKKGY